MKGKVKFFAVTLISSLALAFFSSSAWSDGACATDTSTQFDPYEILSSMRDSYKSVDGYTAVLVKGEPSMNKKKPPQTILLKFRKPFHVYMKWVENPHKGREIIYKKGENKDNILANPGGLLGVILRLVKLPCDYKGKDTRYTIRDVGIGKLIDGILAITNEAKDKNELNLTCKGVVERNGRPAYEIVRLLPQGNGYRNTKLVLYVDKETNLPVEVYAYDAKGDLAEYCIYQDIDLKSVLKDEDFSVENEKYGFRYL